MLLSIEFGFAYLTIPFCDVQSLEDVLKPRCQVHFIKEFSVRHINSRQFTKISKFPERFTKNGFESFCLMREPVSWAHELYQFHKFRAEEKNGCSIDASNLSFNEFVERLIIQDEKDSSVSIRSQKEFLEHKGAIGVDRLFAFEKIQLVEEYLSNKLGKPIDLSVNDSFQEYPYQLDSDLNRRLKNYLDEDVALYEALNATGQMNRARKYQFSGR